MSIKATASDTHNLKNVISNRNKSYSNKASLASSTWSGEIGDAYKNFSRRMRTIISTTERSYSNLGMRLDRLDNSIRRAEADDRRKAATGR